MRRQARPVHLARSRLNDVTRTLIHGPRAKWPVHLQLAGKILEQELKVPKAYPHFALASRRMLPVFAEARLQRAAGPPAKK